MAKFSQQFLANLGRPQMAESLFGLGATIGGLPGQAKDQRKQQEFNQLMQQIQGAQGSGDFTSMKILAQQLATTNPQEAAKVMQAALAGEVKQQQTQKETQGTRAGAQMLMTELQDYANNPSLPASARTEASNLLKAAAQAGDRAGLLEPRVQQLRTRLNETAKPVSLSAGGALVSPTGEVLYERPFKPTDPTKPSINIEEAGKNLYVFTNGELTNTIKIEEGEDESLKDRERRTAQIAQVVRSKADIMDLAGPEFMASGLTGKLSAQFLAGSDAYDRQRAIESLKSTLGLEQIANLKRLSSTGSTGLGQVSNLELNALQSEIASLDVGMSEEAQIRSLTKIFNHLDSVQKALSGIGSEDMVNWNSPEYRYAGYSKDEQSGIVFYAPEGKEGTVYKMVNGKFIKADI
jgi:hypothetical protein